MDNQAYYEQMLDRDERLRMVPLPTLCALLDACARDYPALPALSWEGACVAYETLIRDVACARGALGALGLQRGAHVALLQENSYAFVVHFLAITTAGLVAVLVPPATPAGEINALLKKFSAVYLLCDAAHAPQEPAIAYTIDPLFGGEAKPAPACAAIGEDTPAAILFSAGTTGKQKGVLLSHGALMESARNGIYGYRKAYVQTYLLLLPLTHVFGLVRNLLTALYTGSRLHICTNMRNLFQELRSVRPTVLVLVPALAEMLCGVARMQGREVLGGRLSYIICGGAPVAPQLIESLHALGIFAFPGYGLTETANLVSGNCEPLAHPTSVGMPYPGIEVRLAEDGELLVRGKNLMLGYYGDPEETAAAMQDGFLRTGDLATIDEEGRIYIVGRVKNLIITGNGENVSPEELEALLYAIPGVKECLVYEEADRYGRGRIVAEVFPDAAALQKNGVQDVRTALEEAVARMNSTLPAYKQIQAVTLREAEFPRTASLKIARR